MRRFTATLVTFFAVMLACIATASAAPGESVSPDSCDAGHKVLFVFNTGASTVTVDPADPSRVAVAITDADRQSIVFDDRPNRRANAIDTQRVIDFLAEAATNDPANLAIVGQLAGGGKETLVIEVLGARSQSDTAEVSLEGRVLEVLTSAPDGAIGRASTSRMAESRRYESIDVFVDDVNTCCPGDIGCTESYCPD